MRLATLLALATITAGSLAAAPAETNGSPAIGPQYDTTHVYVAPADVDRFVHSFLATFGGQSTKQVVVTVTPTPSKTSSQLLLTPVGSLSVFGFQTPIPYPFGLERTGYLVRDMDAAMRQAQDDGASVVVSTFPDPIGRDAVVQWPGGVNMQIYWHNTPPTYPALHTVPENRVYVPADAVSGFLRAFTQFAHGEVTSDDPAAPGVEIGRPRDTYRRIRISSTFGAMTVLVTDGHLPFPYGHELTGYAVTNLATTLAKARSAGAAVLTGPYAAGTRQAAMVEFPGGYIAEIHSGP